MLRLKDLWEAEKQEVQCLGRRVMDEARASRGADEVMLLAKAQNDLHGTLT